MFSLFGKKKQPDAPDETTLGLVLPRIKTRAFMETIAQVPGMTVQQAPVTLHLVGDLLVVFGVDCGDTLSFLTNQECEEQDIDVAQLLPRSIMNIVPLIQSLKIEPGGGINRLVIGNDLEACAILLALFWETVEKNTHEAPVAIFPHRNIACFTGRSSADGIVALKDIIGEVDFTDTHSLSEKLYVWEDGGWSVFDEPT